ncbi:MAG: glycosyltransferase family 39 protein [Ignavibacteria bacterium]|nr:glycosyltransferase family 39 protein [Ignavibacteria bacterium]
MRNFIYKYRFLLSIALLNFLLVYLATFNNAYGYFIDEFYYLACAKRLAWGYVDHPPLSIAVLSFFIAIFGKSLAVIRIIPAFISSISVFLTGKMAEKFGASSKGQVLAALAIVCTPVSLAFSGFYSMNVFEPLLAISMLLVAIKMVQQQDMRQWIYLGVIWGLGLMNKHTFLLAIAAFLAAVILSGNYKLILSFRFIGALVITSIICLPNIIWQVVNNYPSLEFYRNITSSKNIYTPPLEFIKGQIVNMSPSTLPIWLAGAIAPFISKRLSRFRLFSLFFILIFGFVLLSGSSRADRTLLAYPVVFSLGAVAIEFIPWKRLNLILNWTLPVLLLTGLLIALPLVLPYFSYDTVAAYVKRMHINTEIEKGKKPPLPQLLADRIGWQEKADMFFEVYNSLPIDERKKILISTDNYGKAGALELFGEKFGVALVICSHNNYFLWGKDHLQDTSVLVLDDDHSVQDYSNGFNSVEVYGKKFISPYVSSHENNLIVLKCALPKLPLDTLFARDKFYY